MTLSEHLASFVTTHLDCTFATSVTGGGAMFLNDAFGNQPGLNTIYCHHEQACAMAAVGASKLSGKITTCIVTTGCGSTNAVTGLLDAWQDNVPVLFVSGQVKRRECSHYMGKHLRGLGVQEVDTIEIVKSLTKAAFFVDSKETYLQILPQLRQLLEGGRKGPVWLDIPMDIQSMSMEADEICNAQSQTLEASQSLDVHPTLIQTPEFQTLKHVLAKSRKPVFLVGNGLRLSSGEVALSLLRDISSKHSIPVVTTYLGADFFPTDFANYHGVVGLKASRRANLIVHNADLLICVGTRLATSVIGFEYDLFAPHAFKLVVDIDRQEHEKPTLRPDLFIQSDATRFLHDLPKVCDGLDVQDWQSCCSELKSLLPIQEQFSPDDAVSIYDVVRICCETAMDDDIFVSDAGSSYYVNSIMFTRKARQRYITSGAQADMGFALPAAIGACLNSVPGSRTFAITGDGSLQPNIQELQTVVHHQIPLTIVVLNNDGYLSNRATQGAFFPGRSCGTDSTNGISFPNIGKIAQAYGIDYYHVSTQDSLRVE